jgi:hypothetical protein
MLPVFYFCPQVKNPMTMTEKILAKHSDNANVVPGQVRGVCTPALPAAAAPAAAAAAALEILHTD